MLLRFNFSLNYYFLLLDALSFCIHLASDHIALLLALLNLIFIFIVEVVSQWEADFDISDIYVFLSPNYVHILGHWVLLLWL